MRSAIASAAASALVLAAFGSTRMGYVQAPRPDTTSLCGVATTHGIDVPWATKTATRAGSLSDFVLVVHSAGTAIGSKTARASIRVLGSEVDLCTVDVSCTAPAGTPTAGTCPTPAFAEDEILYVAWTSSDCLTRPAAHASATLTMP